MFLQILTHAAKGYRFYPDTFGFLRTIICKGIVSVTSESARWTSGSI